MLNYMITTMKNHVIVSTKVFSDTIAVSFTDPEMVDDVVEFIKPRMKLGNLSPGLYAWHPMCKHTGILIGEYMSGGSDFMSTLSFKSSSKRGSFIVLYMAHQTMGDITLIFSNTLLGTYLAGIE